MRDKCVHVWKTNRFEETDESGYKFVRITCEKCSKERRQYPYLLGNIFYLPKKAV